MHENRFFVPLRAIESYFFLSGKGNKPYISLPKGKGIKLTIAEERDKRLAAK